MDSLRKAHLGIFERPGADFALRRTLKLRCPSDDPARMRVITAQSSRFVLLAPERSLGLLHYVRADTTDELFRSIGDVYALLGQEGVNTICVNIFAGLATSNLIAGALHGLNKALRTRASFEWIRGGEQELLFPAANDSLMRIAAGVDWLILPRVVHHSARGAATRGYCRANIKAPLSVTSPQTAQAEFSGDGTDRL